MILINNTKNNYLLYAKKENIPLDKMIKNRFGFVPTYMIVEKNKKCIDTVLSEYDLDFYISTNREFYTFYFYKYKITCKNDFPQYEVANKYDSINVDIDQIQLGKKGRNVFILEKGKIKFKNKA